VPILMPQVGLSMEEGTMVEWRVQPGDRIEVGQIIFEVETDKATIEIEADHAGRLAKIVAEVDEIVAVKEPVAYLAENDADVEAYLAARPASAAQTVEDAPPTVAAPSRTEHAPAASAKAPAVMEEGRVKASPAARKLARERGLDLLAVRAGSGPGGRIVLADVEAAAQAPAGPVRRPMSKMRKAIARSLLASKQTIPHFYLRTTIDAGAMVRFYRQRKARFKCTLNDVIVLACARAIREFPAFRSRLEGEEIVELPSANIGLAVGTDEGLVVPVVVGADGLSFEELAAATVRVADAARAGKLQGVGQGVFTITNLGMLGVEEFSAIINPPEAAILAVGAVREEVLVTDGAMHPAQVLTLTISCDHRLIDGAVGVQFTERVRGILENWSEQVL